MNGVKIAAIDRPRLVDVLRGVLSVRKDAVEVNDRKLRSSLKPPSVGVGYIGDEADSLPSLLVVPGNDQREFFAWVSAYCPFATPLSQWCRVITHDELASFRSLAVFPQYGNAGTAWAGAMVGEAILHMGVGTDLSQVSVSALQSCASFVAARAFGLSRSEDARASAVQRYDHVRKLLGVNERRLTSLECQHLWIVLETLSSESPDEASVGSAHVELVVRSCRDIQEAGFVSESTVSRILEALDWPTDLRAFQREGAERRVELFDKAVDNLLRSNRPGTRQASTLEEFIVAYFAARVGGSGSGHLMLLERLVSQHPMLSLWYGVASGLNRPELWGAEFGGLGRLALKELAFPLRIDDRPRCDIAFDELLTISGPQPESERLGFRGATRRALSVEVAAGVNALVGLATWTEQEAVAPGWTVDQALLKDLVTHLGIANEYASRLQQGKPNPRGRRNGAVDGPGASREGSRREVRDPKGDRGQLPLIDS